MAAPVRIQTCSTVDLLILTCRARYCTEQWAPAPLPADGGDGVVQLSQERCPACGSSTWEVTQVHVSGSPSRAQRRRGPHRASRSGSA